jgi:hypothetical protein
MSCWAWSGVRLMMSVFTSSFPIYCCNPDTQSSPESRKHTAAKLSSSIPIATSTMRTRGIYYAEEPARMTQNFITRGT